MVARGIGVDYAHFYHFLEGLVDYPGWAARIDLSSKHRRMHSEGNSWTNPRTIGGAFDELFGRYGQSQLAVSYRNDGIPTIEAMGEIRERGREVELHDRFVLTEAGWRFSERRGSLSFRR